MKLFQNILSLSEKKNLTFMKIWGTLWNNLSCYVQLNERTRKG